jgi:hypothetical protein
MSVAIYTAMVRDRVHFAEAGYRDGEWYCMLGKVGRNINGEKYDPALGALLRRTLLEPVGQWCAFWWPHPTIGMPAYRMAREWLSKHELNVSWLPDRPISRANELGRARPFYAACATRRVVIVGPDHMRKLDLFPVAEHVTIPPAIAWKHTADVCKRVMDVYQPDDLVLFCAGMAANVMIHRLWPELRGRATLLDIGAALDPYCGVMSRGVFREPGWQDKVMPQNRP